MADPICPHCKGKLLVDVVLVTAPADGRSRYQIARGLSKMGPGAPSFAAAQQTVAIPGSVLVSAVTREVARKALAILEEHGGLGRTMAVTEDAPVVVRKTGRLTTVGIMALLLVAGGVPLWKYIQHLKAETETEQLGFGDPDTTQGPELGRKEMTERATTATVSLRCASSIGSGFFVAKDLVLTNAHVLCRQGESLRAVFANGRELPATPEHRDDWLGLALVRVPGANVEPLPLGDATSLRKGDQVLTVGAPEGLDTIQEGTLSNRLHGVLGIGFLDIQAKLNEHSSGGPLLDKHGLVVGVISQENYPERGFALPINYAFSGASPLLPAPSHSAPSSQRWAKLLTDMASLDRREVEQGNHGRSVLIGLTVPSAGGLVAVVALRSQRQPTGQIMTFHFRGPANIEICEIEAAADNWSKVSDTTLSTAQGASSRYIQWLRRNGLDQNAYVGFAELDLRTCPSERMRTAELLLEGADERSERIGL